MATDEARYSPAEEAALRAAGVNPTCSPAQVGGLACAADLDRYAARLEALIPQLRVAAAALRREAFADA